MYFHNTRADQSFKCLFWLLCLQMVSEKVGGAEGTKLDEDFKDLERVTGKFTSQENVLLVHEKKVIANEPSISRKQMLPAKLWWKLSVKHQSTSNQTQQPEPS